MFNINKYKYREKYIKKFHKLNETCNIYVIDIKKNK